MKAFAKVTALAMTLALACVLTACGGSGSSSSAAVSGSTAATSNVSASVSSSIAFEKGAAKADTYTNEFFGIQFTLPVGFTFYDDAQLAELNKSINSTLSDEEIAKALESGATFFDMAAAAENGTNVNVVIEYAGTPAAQAIDAAGYIEASMATLEKQLKESGITLKSAESGTYKNPETGDEFASMKLEIESQGTAMYEELVCVKAGNYFMNITVTSQSEADLDKILENLSLLK